MIEIVVERLMITTWKLVWRPELHKYNSSYEYDKAGGS